MLKQLIRFTLILLYICISSEIKKNLHQSGTTYTKVFFFVMPEHAYNNRLIYSK
jgi:hypothetical protein